MGSPVHQIFSRRGDEKGQSLWLKSAPALLLTVAWAGLLPDFPARFPRIWFPYASAVFIATGLLHISSRRVNFSIEAVFSAVVLYAGLTEYVGLPWLAYAYIPLLAGLSAFYPPAVVISLSVLLPFTALRSFASERGAAGGAAFYLFLIAAAAAASYLAERLRRDRQKAVAELDTIKTGALDKTQDTEMESFGSDEVVSHYVASRIRTQEDMDELLQAIRHAVFADAAHFFEPQGATFSLRASTDPRKEVLITGRGLMASCLRERKPFVSGDVDETKLDLGYIREGRIHSLIAMPVMEGTSPVGLLLVDSARRHAFGEPEQKTVRMFSAQIAKLLERERVYTVIKHDITALRIIRDFSSSLASSIRYDEVVSKLCHYAHEAFRGSAFFLEHRNDLYRICHFEGETGETGSPVDLTGTLAGLAVENRHKEYVSDLKQYSLRALPARFRVENVRSAIALPLFFEGSLLGVFGLLSTQREFLGSRQISLIEMMCNQAATSIANAKMHAEIELMATTDGLTGLFNHRIFQQKLSEEIKRSGRHQTPVSLLLTDIDFFKKVNDTYGHPAGDAVLRGVAALLRREIRDIDSAARYGGEEFAVILPGTDARGARNIAERLRMAIMEETFSIDGRALKVTTSIGISTLPDEARTKEELIEKTDQALYHAKHNGRNRSVNWGQTR